MPEISGDSSLLLTRQILQATGTDSCRFSESLLCDYLAAGIDPDQRHYLEAHLADCGDCRALESALQAVHGQLAAAAELAPSADLVTPILQQTSLRQASRKKAPGRILDTLRSFTRQLMLRPRITLEAAFVLTVLWVSAFGLPAAVNVPAQAASLAYVDGESLQRSLRQTGTQLNSEVNRIPQAIRGLWQSGAAALQQHSTDFLDRLDAWAEQLPLDTDHSQ